MPTSPVTSSQLVIRRVTVVPSAKRFTGGCTVVVSIASSPKMNKANLVAIFCQHHHLFTFPVTFNRFIVTWKLGATIFNCHVLVPSCLHLYFVSYGGLKIVGINSTISSTRAKHSFSVLYGPRVSSNVTHGGTAPCSNEHINISAKNIISLSQSTLQHA